MNKIRSNSFESVLFFVIYICFQDGKLSKEEVAELSLQSMVLKKFYFECFGEICDLEIESLAYEMKQELEDKYHVLALSLQMKKSSTSIPSSQTLDYETLP